MDTKTLESTDFSDIIGQEEVKRQLKSALLSGHNIMIVGPPGVGKTTLAKNVAKVLHTKNFVRVQGSPDLTAEDLLGDIDPIKALKFGPLSKEAFTPGKLLRAHNGVLFFDEINRAPEKLQNALLQILEEGKATIGSYDVDFESDFIFIATMNPQDINTEKLSDVLLDMFDFIYMGYPENDEVEKEIADAKLKKDIIFPDKLLSFTIRFVRLLRADTDIEKKPSVRAMLSLVERSQSNAKLRGIDEVAFEDIKNAVISVLAHRIELKPSLRYLRSTEEFVREKFEQFRKANGDEKEKSGDGL